MDSPLTACNLRRLGSGRWNSNAARFRFAASLRACRICVDLRMRLLMNRPVGFVGFQQGTALVRQARHSGTGDYVQTACFHRAYPPALPGSGKGWGRVLRCATRQRRRRCPVVGCPRGLWYDGPFARKRQTRPV